MHQFPLEHHQGLIIIRIGAKELLNREPIYLLVGDDVNAP